VDIGTGNRKELEGCGEEEEGGVRVFLYLEICVNYSETYCKYRKTGASKKKVHECLTGMQFQLCFITFILTIVQIKPLQNKQKTHTNTKYSFCGLRKMHYFKFNKPF